MKLNLKSNIKQVVKELEKEKDLVRKAQVSATRKTTDQTFTRVSETIREDYTAKAKYIKRGMYKRKPNIKSDVVTGQIVAKTTPLPVASFKVSQNKKGVRAVIRKGKPKLIPSAFKEKLPSGHTGVFKFNLPGRKRRKPAPRYETRNKGGKKYTTRLPIDELFSLSVYVMAVRKKVINNVKKFAPAKFREVFARDYKYFQSKRRG